MRPIRNLLKPAAERLTNAAPARLAGLHDLFGLRSVLVPAIVDGAVQTTNLTSEEPSEGRYLHTPPRALVRCERFDEAFVADPLPLRPSRVTHVRRARAVGADAALVEAETGRLYADSVAAPSRIDKLRVSGRARLLERPRRLSQPVCVFVTQVSRSYFHFVTDLLTRLYAFSDHGTADLARFRRSSDGITFLLDAGAPSWQLEYLALLGLRFDVHKFGSDTNLVVDDLVFPTYVGVQHPRFGAVLLPQQATAWLRRLLREAAGAPVGSARRLYISRAFAPSRRVENAAEVDRVLATRGFEPVVAEHMSVREQIATFAAAEAIVAPHGAGLTNILFADPCTVIEFVSPAHVVPCYYLLGEPLGHDYWYVVGQVDEAAAGFTADYAVDPDLLAATLDTALATAGSTISPT